MPVSVCCVFILIEIEEIDSCGWNDIPCERIVKYFEDNLPQYWVVRDPELVYSSELSVEGDDNRYSTISSLYMA